MPVQGESVQLIGCGFKKVLGSGSNVCSFLKIYCSSLAVITHEQEMEFCMKAAHNRKHFKPLPTPETI